MSNYYVVCNVNGPISMRLDADNIDSAKAEFASLRPKTLQNAIDDARTHIEDDLGISGENMTETEFDRALSKAGAEPVCSLAEVINAHAGTVAHESGGWYLWRTDERDA